MNSADALPTFKAFSPFDMKFPRRFLFAVLIAVTCFHAEAQLATSQLSTPAQSNAMSQIAALEAEVRTLPRSQQRIASSLREAARQIRGDAPRAHAPKLTSGLHINASRRLTVDIKAQVTDDLLAEIRARGGTVISSFAKYQSIRAELPPQALDAIAAQPGIRWIQPADFGTPNIGSRDSEGDVAHAADYVRNAYNATGAGVKIGVISTSTRYLAELQAANDLPSVTILPGQSGVGSALDAGEGTAMLAIIHDLAPGAQLYFATGTGGGSGAAANVLALADAGCQIIVDDMTYRDDSPFHENTPMSQAVQEVSDRGVLYFSSAANSGSVTKRSSGTWQGNFVNSTIAGGRYGSGQLHDWGGGNIFNAVTNNNSSAVVLYWSDPLGGSANDYNLFVVDGDGNVVNQSVFTQTGTDDPFEIVPAATNGQFIVVTRVSGAARFLHLDTWRGRLSISTTGSTRGHNASSAANAFSVAAASAEDRTTMFTGFSGETTEVFSSDGPRRIFYEVDGTEITPGNRTGTGGRVLLKPEITAADATLASSAFPGESSFASPFFGTSAAAPHAAAIAALLKSYRPDLSASQIRAALQDTAIDIEAAGFDRDSGHGLIMADRALASVAPTVSITSPTDGGSLSFPPQMTGTASGGGGITLVRVALSRTSDGRWYNFNTGTWGSTTFDFNSHVRIATGTTSWSAPLPAVGLGNYHVHAQSVGAHSNGSIWVKHGISGDAAPPVVSFSPFTNQQTIATFTQLGGLVSEPGAVTFRIEEFNVGGVNRYWNGASWITDGNSSSVWLTANITGISWHPAPGTLPTRGQTRPGHYMVYVRAQDAAGNVAESNLVLIRSEADKTPPVVGFITPSNGHIFTNNVLPGFVGTAGDPDTGISAVNLLLYRVVNGEMEFWDGTAWQVDPVSLNASFGLGVWSFHDLPAGANLPNGTYGLNVTAQNGEVPSGGGGLGITFEVDYHPVHIWTRGSWSDGISGNENDDWDNPANWVGGVPGTNGIAVIGSIAHANGSKAVYGLDVNAGVLNTTGLLIHKRLNLRGGAVSGGMINLASNAVARLSGGSFSGEWNVLPGSHMIVETTNVVTFSGGTLNNRGRISWTNAGYFWGGSGATISNLSIIDLQGDGWLRYNNAGAYCRFVNSAEGVLRKSAGQTNLFTADAGGWIFENHGQLDIQTGSLELWGSQNYLLDGGRITGAGRVTQAGGALTLSGTTTFTNGTFAKTGGSLFGTGQFAGSGTFDWIDGIILNGAHLTVGPSMEWLLTGSHDKLLRAGTIVHHGTLKCLGTGSLVFSTGAVFHNHGLVEARADSVFHYDNGGGYTHFHNHPGAIFRKINSGTATFTTHASGIAFHNHGLVDVLAGRLQFGGGGTSSGEFRIASGADIELTGNTQILQEGGMINGGGVLRVAGGRLNLNAGTNAIVLNGTVELVTSGFLGGSARLDGTGSVSWKGGTLDATLNITPAITLHISGSDTKLFNIGRIRNHGTIHWLDDGAIQFSNGALLTNNALFHAQGSGSFTYNNAGGYVGFDNGPAGVLRRSGSGTNRFAPEHAGVWLRNWGTLDIQSGTFQLDNSSKTFFDGGKIEGPGLLRHGSGAITLAGMTELPGTLEWAGGQVVGTGGFKGNGTLRWTGGHLLSAQLTNDTVTLHVTGSASKTMSASAIHQNGNTLMEHPGNFLITSGARFNNAGEFVVTTNTVFFYDNAGSNPVFHNQANATFKTVSTNRVTFSPNAAGIVFENEGVVDLQAGELHLGGGGGSSGVFNAAQGTRLDFIGQHFVLRDGAVFDGDGTYRVSAWRLALNNSATGTVTLNSALELVPGSHLSGHGQFSGNGTILWSGGTIDALVKLNPGITMNIAGPEMKTFSVGRIENRSTINWLDDGPLLFASGSRITNAGIFHAQGSASITYNNAGNYPGFDNGPGGTLRKSGTLTNRFGSESSGVQLNNWGWIDVQSGVLQLANDTKVFHHGSTISGAGRLQNVAGTVSLSGNLHLTGTLEIAGGTIKGVGTFTGAGLWDWSGGSIHGALLTNTASLRVSPGDSKWIGSGAQLHLSGNTTITEPGQWTFSNGAQLFNSGLMEVRTNTTFFYDNGGSYPAFHNLAGGTFRKTGAGTTTFSGSSGGIRLNNAGIIDLRHGTLAIESPFTSASSAQTRVALNDASTYPRELVSGHLARNGSLLVTLTNGFVPTNGMNFVIASHASAAGQFTSFTLPPLSSSLQWRLDYGTTQTTLRVERPHLLNAPGRPVGGQFSLPFSGPAAASAVLLGSTNLVHWVPIQTNAPFTGSFDFTDPHATNRTGKYYRVMIEL